MSSVTLSMKQDATLSLMNKTIVHTINSKMMAQGTLTDACKSVLTYTKTDGEVIPIAGDDGLQFKVFVMLHLPRITRKVQHKGLQFYLS